jgi:hypothetical protein
MEVYGKRSNEGWTRGIVLAAFVLALGAVEVNGQSWRWPDTLQNAKVLPEVITSRVLQEVMIGFTRQLGVRCSYCHVGEEGQPLSQYDFASDDRPAKGKARTMMRMVRAINEDHLTELGVPEGERTVVTCVTCHRGASKPQMLDEVLREKLEAEGVEAMLAEYRALREQSHGGFTYDFGEDTLARLGRALLEEEQAEAGLAVLRLNAEMFPASGGAYAGLAEGYLAARDTTRARILLEKAVGMDPEDRTILRRLQQLTGN